MPAIEFLFILFSIVALSILLLLFMDHFIRNALRWRQ